EPEDPEAAKAREAVKATLATIAAAAASAHGEHESTDGSGTGDVTGPEDDGTGGDRVEDGQSVTVPQSAPDTVPVPDVQPAADDGARAAQDTVPAEPAAPAPKRQRRSRRATSGGIVTAGSSATPSILTESEVANVEAGAAGSEAGGEQ
ncbi:hypothetical protein PU560_14065, partial [Georgenia sp. 10Sc9-8]|nr:hypothetical protein [Georgenia halotolerans]